jgi:hypothetical protein
VGPLGTTFQSNANGIALVIVPVGTTWGVQAERPNTRKPRILASRGSKRVAMAQLVKIAKEVAKKKAWEDIERNAFVAVIKKIAQALGVRLNGRITPMEEAFTVSRMRNVARPIM